MCVSQMSFVCVRKLRGILSHRRKAKFSMFAKPRFISNFEWKKNGNCVPLDKFLQRKKFFNDLALVQIEFYINSKKKMF